jgi:hypothetical protein
MPSDWCGRSSLYQSTQASSSAWARARLAKLSQVARNSVRSVLCQRSIFPVAVGVRGLVSRVMMPFSRQIRSNSTSEGRGRVNLPVNCLPLSESTSAGTPNRARAPANAVQTARLVARVTSRAITQ